MKKTTGLTGGAVLRKRKGWKKYFTNLAKKRWEQVRAEAKRRGK